MSIWLGVGTGVAAIGYGVFLFFERKRAKMEEEALLLLERIGQGMNRGSTIEAELARKAEEKGSLAREIGGFLKEGSDLGKRLMDGKRKGFLGMIYYQLGSMIMSSTTTSKVVNDLGKRLRAIKEIEMDLEQQTSYAFTMLQFLAILGMPIIFHILAWALDQSFTLGTLVYLGVLAGVISFMEWSRCSVYSSR